MFEFSSSSFSKTDCVSRISSLEIATMAILQIINNVAIIEVNFVKKVCQKGCAVAFVL